MPQPAREWAPAVSATRDPAIFFVWACACAGLFVASFAIARGHKDVSGIVLLPVVAAFMTYDNAVLAIDALNGVVISALPPPPDGGTPPSAAALDASEGAVVVGLQRLRGAVAAFTIPLLLLAQFELNYEVHKRRSANMMCNLIQFDSGHRTSTGMFGALVRYSLWLVALGLLLMQIVINAPAMAEPGTHMPRASRWNAYGGQCISATDAALPLGWGDAMDFAPMAALLLFSGYTGLSLWRYGTTISTDVRATALNPWASLFVAACGLAVGWALTPLAWPLPYATSALLIVLLGALVVTQGCVQGNLATLEQWGRLLAAANDDALANDARRKEAELQLLAAAAARQPDGALRPRGGAAAMAAPRSTAAAAAAPASTNSSSAAVVGVGLHRQRSWREALAAAVGGGSGEQAAGGGALAPGSGAGTGVGAGATGDAASARSNGRHRPLPGGRLPDGDLPMGTGTSAGDLALRADDVAVTFSRHRPPALGAGPAAYRPRDAASSERAPTAASAGGLAAVPHERRTLSSTRAVPVVAASAVAGGTGGHAGAVELTGLSARPRPPVTARQQLPQQRVPPIGGAGQQHVSEDGDDDTMDAGSVDTGAAAVVATSSAAVPRGSLLVPPPPQPSSSEAAIHDHSALRAASAALDSSLPSSATVPPAADSSGRPEAGDDHHQTSDEACAAARYHQPQRQINSLVGGGYRSPLAASVRGRGRGGRR